MRTIRFSQVVAAALLFAFAQQSSATNPQDLYSLPWPESCDIEQGAVSLLVRARDQGQTEEAAVQKLRTIRPNFVVPTEVSAGVFKHRELGVRELGPYMLWACHARAYRLHALPLDEVAKDLRACSEKFRGDPCTLVLHNRVIGAPDNYQPKASVPPVPVPARQ